MRASVIFETEAILPEGAPASWGLPYLNLVVSGKSSCDPFSFLHSLKEFERREGRDLSAPRWAPRVLDLDLLTWGNRVISSKELTIPHPELLNRPFLLDLMASRRGSYRCFLSFPQLMGIVNVTPDSFSDGGQYLDPDRAIQKICEMASQGAAIVDVGAQSTRPGARVLAAEEEWARLQPLFDRLAVWNPPARPLISLDSYHYEVAKRALEHYPVDWLNDVSGGEDSRMLDLVCDTKCKIVLMHSLSVPPEKSKVLPAEVCPIAFLTEWAEKKIAFLEKRGIPKERIVIDPGIGFGKTPVQAFSLLREIDSLKRLGCEILVGHSRKSFLGTFLDRDWETVGISHVLCKKGVDYLRVHNVEAHQRSLITAALISF